MIAISVTANVEKIRSASGKLKRNLEQIADDTANKIVTDSSAAAPDELGMLGKSIYTVSDRKDNYNDTLENVLAIDETAIEKSQVFPEYQMPNPAKGEISTYVVCLMTYGIFVEMGTVRMGAEPFLSPAIERYTEEHVNACAKSVENAYG